jgi:DNA-binding transcriptional MerR regulator
MTAQALPNREISGPGHAEPGMSDPHLADHRMAGHDLDADLGGEASGEAGDVLDQARPRLKKAPNAFRTISEVADELHIPQHVLRFWETKFPQVKPLKRGGGRRYYRPDDIALLRRISDLLYVQGYTIKGVQRLLREGGGRLSDDIPPASPAERAAAESERKTVVSADLLQLPMPGFAAQPVMSPATSASNGPHAADLRNLLRDMLSELEALRALLH